jgi:predicted RND superfamily exporter protein
MIEALENLVFRNRGRILAALGIFTAVMGYYALQLRMDAGFAKQLPLGHEYIETFFEYQEDLFGANRVIIVVRAKDGDIWSTSFLGKLAEATDAVFFLPGIDRRTVTSLWTPNTRYIEITEEGMRSEDVIGGDVTPSNLTDAEVDQIRARVIHGGHVGRLVAKDHSAAMITADVLDVDPQTQEKLDYLDLDTRLEDEIRSRLESDEYDVHILGFVKQMGDIAHGALDALWFFLLAFLLTGAAVHLYSRSIILTVLPLFCSLVSVVWQFAVIQLFGFGLDPLAILVPFLVFAIGVSHGVQQINLITKQISGGADSMTAARVSFRGLLIPGSMALITDLIGFGTLVLIPIPMIQELGITATVGVAFKIVTNLVMLPILASYCRFDPGFAQRVDRSREVRMRAMRVLGRVAERRNALVTLAICAVLLVVAVDKSRDRHVGDLHAGTPELRPDSRYNQDAKVIVEKFGLGLDLLTVIVETRTESCIDYDTMEYLNQFSWHMLNVPGVLSVLSAPFIAKTVNAAWNEGNLKWAALPRNRYALVQATGSIPPSAGLFNARCTMMPLHIFTADHKAETIKRVVRGVLDFRDGNHHDGINIRLGSGNIGVQAATNEVLESSETPMMLYVYAIIIALVIVTYRDWRATVCCCLPLTMATFFGYWFMKELEIGLKVATLPVMVLAVGIGVDYAFYIYNRLQVHLAQGIDITTAYQQALYETGNAVVFTAITLAIGVATWVLSPLKFQADMGLLLTFMFLANMIMAVTALPALAVVLEWVLGPRKSVKAPTHSH